MARLGLTNGVYDTNFWTPEQWQQYGVEGGSIGLNGEMNFGADSALSAPLANQLGMTGLQGLSMSDLTEIAGMGLQALALPSQMEMYGAQTDLLNQQLASNKESAADKQQFQDTWAKASNALYS